MLASAAILATAFITTGSGAATADAMTSTQSPVNINGKNIVLDNISSAPLSRVNVLAAEADTIIGGLMQPGDRIIVTNDYLAWLDLTYSPSDVWAGGMLRGLWTLLPDTDGNLNFRADGAWNELDPYSGSPGSGHSIIANTQAADITSTQFYANREASPVLQNDGTPSAVFTGGVAYQTTGHLTSLAGSIDLDPSTPGTQSIDYQQRYDFGPDAASIRVETYVYRDGDTGNAPVAILNSNYDTAASWTTGYAAPTARPLDFSSSNVARICQQSGASGGPPTSCGTAAANAVVSIPPSEGQVEWWQNSAAASPGTTWWMSESSAPTIADRLLKVSVVYESPVSPVKQMVYTPAVDAESLSFQALTQPLPSDPVNLLPLGWNYRFRYDLSTRP